ncbi:MAG: enoyl-CoA hydratase [Betaproteobacteria bacterium RIFCSPLOWO2_12_FULL_62_13]|nr:MAG: enoyl-CoA hydratase [Betaproteobacteria bacterium RIFCSPLOWO2_12_FULL_62_13]
MSDTVLYAVRSGVASIILNRPQVLNALDAGMMVRLREACEQAARDTAARVILLRGAGPAFLAGGDVTMFHANLPQLPKMVAGLAGELHRAVLALRGAPKPVVASVHGAIAGAGVSLVVAADLVIAAEDARFALAYSRIGTSPDGGATWFLPRLVGYQKALELMLLSEPVDAMTMQALGVVNRLVPVAALEQETQRVVERLACGPTQAYAETKRLANQAFGNSLAAHLDEEAQAFARCAATRDFAEGVTALVEKRAPLFKGQ